MRAGHLQRGTSLVEVLFITGIIVVIVAVGVLTLTQARRQARGDRGALQARAIHQAMIAHAMDNGDYFPGINRSGDVTHPDAAGRQRVLLGAGLLPADYLLSPAEPAATAWTTGPLRPDQFSMALLKIDTPGQRRAEWSLTENAEAAVLSDRNTGRDADANVQSVWTSTPGHWRGHVVWNDNHATMQDNHELPETQYGTAPMNQQDNLFAADPSKNSGGDDAVMVYP